MVAIMCLSQNEIIVLTCNLVDKIGTRNNICKRELNNGATGNNRNNASVIACI